LQNLGLTTKKTCNKMQLNAITKRYIRVNDTNIQTMLFIVLASEKFFQMIGLLQKFVVDSRVKLITRDVRIGH